LIDSLEPLVIKWAESVYPGIRKVFQRQLDRESVGRIRRFSINETVNNEPAWLLAIFLCYRTSDPCLMLYAGSLDFTEVEVRYMLKHFHAQLRVPGADGEIVAMHRERPWN